MLGFRKIEQRCIALLFITSSSVVLCFPQMESSTLNPVETNNSNHTCPRSLDKAKPLRYHLHSERCYKIKTKGPCGNNQLFLALGNSQIYGECDCPFSGFDVPWVYHIQTDKCYKSYEQGYCSEGQWLIFNADKDVQCVSNKCAETILFEKSNTKFVFFKGKCVQLHESSPYCEDGEIVSFESKDVTPICMKQNEGDTISYSISKAAQLHCKAGTRRDIVGKCRSALHTSSSFGR